MSKYTESGLESIVEPETHVFLCKKSVAGMILKKKEILDYGDHGVVVGEVVRYWNTIDTAKALQPILFYGRGFYGSVNTVKRMPKDL